MRVCMRGVCMHVRVYARVCLHEVRVYARCINAVYVRWLHVCMRGVCPLYAWCTYICASCLPICTRAYTYYVRMCARCMHVCVCTSCVCAVYARVCLHVRLYARARCIHGRLYLPGEMAKALGQNASPLEPALGVVCGVLLLIIMEGKKGRRSDRASKRCTWMDGWIIFWLSEEACCVTGFSLPGKAVLGWAASSSRRQPFGFLFDQL